MSKNLYPLPYIKEYAEAAFDMIINGVDTEHFSIESLNVIANVYYRGFFILGMPKYSFGDNFIEDLQLQTEFVFQFTHINEYISALAETLRQLNSSNVTSSDLIAERLQLDMIDMYKYRIDIQKIKRPIFRGGKRKRAKVFDIEDLIEKMSDDFSHK